MRLRQFSDSLASWKPEKSIEGANKLTAKLQSLREASRISSINIKLMEIIITDPWTENSPPASLSQIYANQTTFRGVMFMFRVDLIVDPHDSYANHLHILTIFLHFTHFIVNIKSLMTLS